MSKLSDYSKFDHIDTDSEDETDDKQGTQDSEPTPVNEFYRRDPRTKRFVLFHSNKRVYEWEQTLSEVNVYIPAPLSDSSLIDCTIQPQHLRLGLRPAPNQAAVQCFVNHPTGGTIDTTDSTWYMEEVENGDKKRELFIVLSLHKANKAVIWDCVVVTSDTCARLDFASKQQVQQELLMERYNEDCPGFDFTDATVNGAIPDPRTFMDGVKYP